MCALLAVCFVAAAEEPRRMVEVRLTDTPLRVVLDHYAECREIARADACTRGGGRGLRVGAGPVGRGLNIQAG